MNGYYILQDPDKFCFGIDAVLLAHYPAIRRKDTIMDLCCGFAPIPLILHAEARRKFGDGSEETGEKTGDGSLSCPERQDREPSPVFSPVFSPVLPEPLHITGLELQPEVAEVARRSVEENGLSEDISIVTGDVRDVKGLFRPATYSLVTCNPPYMPVGQGFRCDGDAKAIARTELMCTLEDIVWAAAYLLKMSGRFAMIHRPFRLPEIICLLKKYHLEPKRMQLICPAAGAEPTMVLIESVRGAKPNLKMAPPLIVYDANHEYTEEVQKIYGRNTLSGSDADRKS